MLPGILTAQRINTAPWAARMGGRVQFESHAQRIRGFLAEQVFAWIVIGRLMLRIAGVAGQHKLVVAVERTNGDFGKTAINFLVISVVVGAIGVPVVGTPLGKKGNRKTGAPLDLLERFLTIVPAAQLTVFLADAKSSATHGSRPGRTAASLMPFACATISSCSLPMATASK